MSERRMNRLVLASGNAGKIREIEEILSPHGVEVLPQSQFVDAGAEETGLTFVENAILKARHASRHSGLPALADDSGIEVDALNGAPGIYSARFAGPNASDADNNAHLLAALDGVAEAKRTARYQCVMVYLRHADDPTPLICQGTWEGRIIASPRGTGGFGYDPLFWIDALSCTAAELAAEQKHAISHRGQALRGLAAAFTG